MLAIKRDRRMQQVVMFFASFVLKGGRFLGLTTSQFSCPNLARLPPGPARIKSWYHSKFQMILATFSPVIPKLLSDKSDIVGENEYCFLIG